MTENESLPTGRRIDMTSPSGMNSPEKGRTIGFTGRSNEYVNDSDFEFNKKQKKENSLKIKNKTEM